MLATVGPLPTGHGWAFEAKWDGIRAVLYISDTVRILTRNDRDVTTSFPEVAARAITLPGRPLILDGEIVALGTTGAPSFDLMLSRIHVRSPSKQLLSAVPVRLLTFDLLHRQGDSTLAMTYQHRRELLADVDLGTEEISAPPYFTDGPALQAAAEEMGLEGVVAKQLASTYRPGVRTRAWIKVPRFDTIEVLVGGWTPGAGQRRGRIGAVLVGIRRGRALIFAGAVGSGFGEAALAELEALLAPLQVSTSPFANPVPYEYARRAVWVSPRLAGEVRFRNWTADGLLRHPSWRGLRTRH
jgi:bifunctional non-homologous end joining protein LigD